MRVSKRTGKRVLRKRVYRRKRIAPKVSKNVRSYVKKEIARQSENKVVNIEVARQFGSYLDSNTMNAFPMCPYTTLFPGPTLGVNSNNRIGNQIRTRKVMLNYVITPTPYNATVNPSPQPCHIQMYLGYVKQTSGVLPTSSDFGFLYNNGSSSYAPSGTISDLVAQVNTDHFTILKSWTHKVGFASSIGATGANLGWAGYANNDYSLNIVKKLPITQFCPRLIKMNDSLQSVSGRSLFLFYQAIGSNGLALASGIRPVQINFWVHYEYEDL